MYLTLSNISMTATEMARATQLVFHPYVSTLGLPTDWDYEASFYSSKESPGRTFSWTAIKGATYDIGVSSFFDPKYLLVFDSAGREVATREDEGLYGADYVLNYVAPYSGTFYLTAGWDQGYADEHKFVSVSVHEDRDTLGDDYADNISTVGSLTVGGQATGNIEVLWDTDAFWVDLQAGTTYVFEMLGARGGGGTLGAGQTFPGMYLTLFSSYGIDFSWTSSGSVLEEPVETFKAPSSGHYYVVASNLISSGVGTYTIRVNVLDTTAPTVSAFNPVDEAVDVSVGGNISIQFSESIQRGTGNIVLKTSTGSTVATFNAATSTDLSIVGSTLTINPPNDLAPGVSFKLEMPAGSVKDMQGNSFAGTTAYNFTSYRDPADETFRGTAGNESFTGGPGNDTIDGGAGTDTCRYSSDRSAYALVKTSNGFRLTDQSGVEGVDALVNVERLSFHDVHVALDMGINQSGGGAALLIGAVLGHAALADKKPLVETVIHLFDFGLTLQQLSGAVMRLPVWDVLTGAAAPNNESIAAYLLTTVNGVAPSAAVLASAVAQLNAETDTTQGNFLWHLAESAANQTQVGLVGLVTTGLEFGGTG